MTHPGNNLKPVANQYPKGFVVKDPARVFSYDWEKNANGQSGANLPNAMAIHL
jgi:hypothetical protein